MLQDPSKFSLMKLINHRRIISTIFGIVFLTSGLVINFLQFLLYVCIKPFNIHLFRRYNYYLNYMLYSQVIFLQQYLANVQFTLYSEKNDFENFYGKESAIILSNHRYEIDWMICWVIGDAFNLLGNVHGFAKKSIQYVPTVGYAWKIGDTIFLERSWQKDEKVLTRKLRQLLTFKDPFWLVLTAEGTRYTKEKHEASRAFAKKMGLPELQYHLTPRTKGFATTVNIARKKMPAIYNVVIAIIEDDVKPTLTSILLGKSLKVAVYVERIPMKDLPENEADLSIWLHSMYKRKDDLLHSYFTTGHWKAISNPKQYKSYLVPRKIFPALNFAFCSILVLLPFGFFLMKLLLTGSLLNVATVVGIIGSFVYVLEQLSGTSKISHASSYGTS